MRTLRIAFEIAKIHVEGIGEKILRWVNRAFEDEPASPTPEELRARRELERAEREASHLAAWNRAAWEQIERWKKEA